jgi:hypothetical protein
MTPGMPTRGGKSPRRTYISAAAAGLALLGLILVGGRLGWFGARGPDAELLAQPAYRVLRQHEPEAWQRVRIAHTHIGDDAGRSNFVNVANAEFTAAATRRLGRASPESQLALLRDMLNNLRRLRARPGDACFRYLYPEIAGQAGVAMELPADAQARTLALAAEVIRTAAETPAPPPPAEEAARKLGPVVDAVYAQFGADTQLMSHVREPDIDRVKVCDIAIALYQHILALPPADASQVISAVAATP